MDRNVPWLHGSSRAQIEKLNLEFDLGEYSMELFSQLPPSWQPLLTYISMSGIGPSTTSDPDLEVPNLIWPSVFPPTLYVPL